MEKPQKTSVEIANQFYKEILNIETQVKNSCNQQVFEDVTLSCLSLTNCLNELIEIQTYLLERLCNSEVERFSNGNK